MKILGAVVGGLGMFYVCWNCDRLTGTSGRAAQNTALCTFCATPQGNGGLTALAVGVIAGWFLGGMLEK